MKALIVKEDGLIYAAEVPEWPNYVEDNHLWNHNLKMRYEVALTSAKESALLCADQEKANKLLIGVGALFNTATLKPKPGIYPIPDLQWQVRTLSKGGRREKDGAHFDEYDVAILIINKASDVDEKARYEANLYAEVNTETKIGFDIAAEAYYRGFKKAVVEFIKFYNSQQHERK